MELVLSAIASGGVIGIADQYLCLLILSISAKTGIVELNPEMQFIESWWFIAIISMFWFLTNAPSYSTILAPGVMHVINTIVNFMSGFLVPASAALISLASVGVIINMHGELSHILETMQLFKPDGGIGTTGLVVAGGSAVAAASITAMKAVAKPAISTSTGTTATASAPIYTTLENIGSIILMGLLYVLSKIDPWLLVGLFGGILLITLILLGFAIYQLVRLKRGIGRVLYLAQTYPKAGLAIAAEFFLWGSGWLAWNKWARGVMMLLAWILWLVITVAISTIVTGIFAFFPPLLPVMITLSTIILFVIFIMVGLSSSQDLLRTLEKEIDLSQPAITESGTPVNTQ